MRRASARIGDFAHWLYRQRQTEYDHLTSDEAVEDGIIANEYTFTAGGGGLGENAQLKTVRKLLMFLTKERSWSA